MKIKKILPGILCLMVLMSCNKKSLTSDNKKSIVTTNFICYDMARGICAKGDAEKNKIFAGMQNVNVDLQMILKPGTDLHSFDPSPMDIIMIENADVFIYTGGESDEWVKKLLKTLKNPPACVFSLMENIDIEESHENCTTEDHDHDSHAHKFDEHIWTSPQNTLELLDKLTLAISNANAENAEIYQANATIYKEEIRKAQTAVKDVLATKQKHLLVMGDRFPLVHFAKEFDLQYYAAFSGCSSAVEASPATISKLINIIKTENLPAVFTIELSNRRIAKTISESAGVKVLELNAAHNLTQEQFNAQMTYVDTLYANAKALDAGLR
jgi:zinc transport system substrate-binding protein